MFSFDFEPLKQNICGPVLKVPRGFLGQGLFCHQNEQDYRPIRLEMEISVDFQLGNGYLMAIQIQSTRITLYILTFPISHNLKCPIYITQFYQ